MQHLIHIIPSAIAIGVLVSAPMGPIGMLVIQRTLIKGRRPALFTGVGAALSDLIYCLLTGFGISFVTDIIDQYQFLLQVVGSLVIGLFGLVVFRRKVARTIKEPEMMKGNSFWMDFISGFFLTFSNPLILFFIIGLFARFNFIQSEYYFYHYIVAYLFIFLGALLWWYMITMVVDKLRARINARWLIWINRTIGSVLMIMAIVGVITAIV